MDPAAGRSWDRGLGAERSGGRGRESSRWPRMVREKAVKER